MIFLLMIDSKLVQTNLLTVMRKKRENGILESKREILAQMISLESPIVSVEKKLKCCL